MVDSVKICEDMKLKKIIVTPVCKNGTFCYISWDNGTDNLKMGLTRSDHISLN